MLYSLAPLSLCLFLISGRKISKAWYLGVIPVSVLAAMTPGRTTALSAVLITAIFMSVLLLAGFPEAGRKLRAGWALATVAGLMYFVVVGTLLGKDEVDPTLNIASWVPLQAVSPILYLTGGITAFSVAAEYGLQSTDWGRSIYTLLRIGEELSPWSSSSRDDRGVCADPSAVQCLHGLR